jgi:uncharacterized hydrophobic protein (TIGR00271 family)
MQENTGSNDTAPSSRLFLWRLRRWWQEMVAAIDHGPIIKQVIADGRLSYSYAFMVLISAGIATIGLLMNSAAVIIGAMLISPLMGPIVLAGLSIALAAPKLAARSALGLLVGILLALAISVTIVHFSPLHYVTAEILSRTRPNLFDLLVAFLSGLAGGYAVVRGRGSAIVGVAIATALMPPLAVVGYGLATLNGTIAEGAGLLFLTNLVAIAFAVAIVTLWYGFLPREWQRRHVLWQSFLAATVLVLLAIPLFKTLLTVASETSYTETARAVLAAEVRKHGNGRVVQFDMRFPHRKPLEIQAIVVSRHPDPHLVPLAQRALTSNLGRPVSLQLSQVQTWQVTSATALAPTVTNTAPPPATSAVLTADDIAKNIRAAFPFPLRIIDVDAATKQITLLPAAGNDTTLGAWQKMEEQLQDHYRQWKVVLIPPLQSLPTIDFTLGSSSIDARQEARLAAIVWALQRWKIPTVEVIGRASTLGNQVFNAKLAKARARKVAELLQAGGITVRIRAQFVAPGQLQEEPQRGFAYYQSVDIRLPRVETPAQQ